MLKPADLHLMDAQQDPDEAMGWLDWHLDGLSDDEAPASDLDTAPARTMKALR